MANGPSKATTDGFHPAVSDKREIDSPRAAITNGFHPTLSDEGEIDSPRARIFVLTAADKISTKAQATNLLSYLKKVQGEGQSSFMDDLAYTLSQKRTFFEHRIAMPSRTLIELTKSLEANDLEPVGAFEKPDLGFVFTGQGSQWYAMGRELMQDYPTFWATLSEADAILKDIGAQWSLIGTFYINLSIG